MATFTCFSLLAGWDNNRVGFELAGQLTEGGWMKPLGQNVLLQRV